MNSALYTNVRAAGLTVSHACEVGVFLPDTSNVLGWIQDGTRTTLVECDPAVVTALHARFDAMPNVHILPVAVADEASTLTFYRTGASTFGSNVPSSPALVNDGYKPSERDVFTVPAVTFDTIDDSSIDVLSVDVEGGEWYVLRHLHSRPQVICVETHGKRYVNPFLREITEWTQANGYGSWYFDDCDTVYRLGWTAPTENRATPLGFWQRIKKTLRGY